MMENETQGSGQQLAGPTTYTIGGVKVEFPTKAYPSQLAMMNKVIQGLKHKQNCLLESPTGSGKSLALLCATLAWQRHEAARVDEYNAAIDARSALAFEDYKKQKQQRRKTQDSRRSINTNGKNGKENPSLLPDNNDGSCSSAKEAMDMTMTDSDDDLITSPFKRTKTTPVEYDENFEELSPSEFNDGKMYQKEIEELDDLPFFETPEKKLGVPRIYFGTRTHKQISQITRELRKTIYTNSRSVILASRDHTCINPMVQNLSNKNEACKELLDSMNTLSAGCGFYTAAKKLGSFNVLPSYGVRPGYDLEDLVAAGREAKSCPYYASRYLMSVADIVFCPYNYLIDPFTRKSMAIELENQVVIFDEGHNMEDASREAASFTINQEEIQAAIQDCEKISNSGVEPYAHSELAKLFSTLSGWMDRQTGSMKTVDFDNNGKCFNGTDFVASLEIEGLVPARLKQLQDFYKAVLVQKEKDIEQAKERGGRGVATRPCISQPTSYLCEVLFRMFSQLNQNSGIHRDDFRVALLQSVVRRRTKGQYNARQVTSLNFWCLNPAVAFEEIQKVVHSIILTSGTLSPMQSFQSELGTAFPIKLEASHVIDKNQVWAAVLGSGPTNVNLNGSYANAQTLAYQDELGNVVLSVCMEMPHGILCFFPSYRMLETVSERWKVTNMWNNISRVKMIFIEPRTGASDFQEVMTLFYESVAQPMGGRNGALFLAVCRGKVSEGLDFADNNARAVICIGIPFPNYRDMQVEHKRGYNDKNRNRGLLSGSEWYEIQAFRALNQALGRCIRHRYDWGAILLVDDRYCKTPRYANCLSKWIRSSVQNFKNWNSCRASMISFRTEMSSKKIQEATQFGAEWDVTTQMSEFHAAPLDESYEANANNLVYDTFKQPRQGLSSSYNYGMNSNSNHPIQFDTDGEEVDLRPVALNSQSSDETFVVGAPDAVQNPLQIGLIDSTTMVKKEPKRVIITGPPKRFAPIFKRENDIDKNSKKKFNF